MEIARLPPFSYRAIARRAWVECRSGLRARPSTRAVSAFGTTLRASSLPPAPGTRRPSAIAAHLGVKDRRGSSQEFKSPTTQRSRRSCSSLITLFKVLALLQPHCNSPECNAINSTLYRTLDFTNLSTGLSLNVTLIFISLYLPLDLLTVNFRAHIWSR
jgi:hypothetical protein